MGKQAKDKQDNAEADDAEYQQQYPHLLFVRGDVSALQLSGRVDIRCRHQVRIGVKLFLDECSPYSANHCQRNIRISIVCELDQYLAGDR